MQEAIPHPDWEKQIYLKTSPRDSDIAILKLTEPVTMNRRTCVVPVMGIHVKTYELFSTGKVTIYYITTISSKNMSRENIVRPANISCGPQEKNLRNFREKVHSIKNLSEFHSINSYNLL